MRLFRLIRDYLYKKMGIIYCCFEHAPTDSNRESAYKVDDGENNQTAVQEVPKTYSWDNRAKMDPKQFMFDGAENETRVKTSGQINGQQFIIQNCKESNLFLFDHSASVTVDDCTNCAIFIGPCKGSVFIRDCMDCTVVLSCQQFRTRDCTNVTVFMHCSTQPIIEASRNVKLACLQIQYDGFGDQLNGAGLSPFNNQWSNIHDFTPEPSNFSYLPEETNVSEFVTFQDGEGVPKICTDSESSAIPQSLGLRKKPTNETAFCLCFSTDSDIRTLREKCIQLVKEVGKEGCRLVSGKEVTVSPDDLYKILDTKKFDSIVVKGPVIGLELCGAEALSTLRSAVAARDWTQSIHVPADEGASRDELRKFMSFAETLMGV